MSASRRSDSGKPHREAGDPPTGTWKDAAQKAQAVHRESPKFHAPPEVPEVASRVGGSGNQEALPIRPPQAPRRAYPLKTLAKRFAVSEEWLQEEVEAGNLPAYRLEDEPRVADAALDEWLAQKEWTPEADLA